MNKSDLIRNISKRLPDLPGKDVDEAVRLLFDLMASTLAKGGRCEIRGFGTFSVHVKKARIARNPKTEASVHVPEKRVPHFKPAKHLREQVMLSMAETPIKE